MNAPRPPTFHALSRAERDHLLAVKLCGDGPNGLEVQGRVAQLRDGQEPSRPTTYSALQRLDEWGLIDKEVCTGSDAGQHIYEITDEGLAYLAEAVAANPA